MRFWPELHVPKNVSGKAPWSSRVMPRALTSSSLAACDHVFFFFFPLILYFSEIVQQKHTKTFDVFWISWFFFNHRSKSNFGYFVRPWLIIVYNWYHWLSTFFNVLYLKEQSPALLFFLPMLIGDHVRHHTAGLTSAQALLIRCSALTLSSLRTFAALP